MREYINVYKKCPTCKGKGLINTSYTKEGGVATLLGICTLGVFTLMDYAFSSNIKCSSCNGSGEIIVRVIK